MQVQFKIIINLLPIKLLNLLNFILIQV